MKTDRVFVLLLVVLLPLSGCFDGTTTGEVEAQDEVSENTNPVNPSEGMPSTVQQRIWYSSGGTYSNYWDDNGVAEQNDATACKDWGPTYDQDSGEYLGEICRETGYRDAPEQWNGSECTDAGGQIVWPENANSSTYNFRRAPSCSPIELATINTSSGEALLIYHMRGVSMETTCDGVSYTTSSNYYGLPGNAYGGEFAIVSGSSLNCTHVLRYSMGYSSSDAQTIWSLVYALQDVIVV